jgi:hypothetical protein
MEGAALIVQRWFASVRIDRHAADGIACHRLLRVIVMMVMTMAVMAVIMFVMQCHIKLHCPESGVG